MQDGGRVSERTAEQPPGPRGRWLVGNGYDYDQDRIGFLRRCQAEYGDVFSFSPSTIVVCDPELIHELLDQPNEILLAESPLFASAEDSAKLEREAEGWMRSRKLGFQSMTRSVTKAHGARVIGAFDTILRSTAGQEFDVVAAMRKYSSHLIADFLFGPGADDVVAAADVRSEIAVSFMSNNLTFPKWLPLPSVRRALRAEDKVIAALTDQVRRRQAEPHDEPQDMLDLLLDDSDIVLSEDEVVAMLGASLLASFGSPGTALSWVIREIARDGEVYRRLREEALQVVSEGGSLTDDSRLSYSKAFVKEVLRLYPPVWLMGRTACAPYKVGDWPLAVGQTAMFCPYLLQRDPRWWPDADQLQPERWLQRAAPGSRRAYIPFGAGPRICLGLHLGLYQLATAASHLAAYYRVESSNAAVVQPDPHAILLPRGLRARVTSVAQEPAAQVTAATAEAVTR
jgi:unspecific monooxygenase